MVPFLADHFCHRAFDTCPGLQLLQAGAGIKSPMAKVIGKKGYHAATFSEGPYPL